MTQTLPGAGPARLRSRGTKKMRRITRPAQIIAVASTLWTAFYAPPLLVLVRKLSLIATFALTLISWFHYTWRETRRLGSEDSRNPA